MRNFYSDTQTRPSEGMLEAAIVAEVGDEQRDADPTTRALCERVAALLGKESAVFLPSGTMCNEIAVAVHCRPGDEVICEATCHLINFEGGGPAALSGVMLRSIDGDRGVYGPDQAQAAIRAPSRYAPVSRLLSVEQTANMAGGAVWPVETLGAVAQTARDAGLKTHMDGARLMNAVAASGQPAAAHAAGFDSAWIDLTKGLGCPVGAVLAGDAAFIEAAWRLKQRWGGAMRQSGVLAAMGLYALDHNLTRLADDHALAASIAERLSALPVVAGVLPTQTNIVILDLAEDGPTADDVVESLAEQEVDVGAFGARRVRIVTHLDVGPEDGDALVAAFAQL